MVLTAAVIMTGGTAYAFYSFRQALMGKLGTAESAAAFLQGDVSGNLNGLIVDQMMVIALVIYVVQYGGRIAF